MFTAERAMSVRKLPVAIHEIGHGGDRQRGPAFDQNDMKADAQSWEGLGARNGIGGGRRRHHERRGGEDAVAVALFHRVVHFARRAEIVGGDDEAFHG